MCYSLDFRKPGKFDSRSRKLGVMFIYPKSLEVSSVDVLWRAPFPDRTLMMKYKEKEIVEDLQPDFVTFDANEPNEDAFDIENMVFFDNKDKGAGAKRFFTSLVENGLADSFSLTHKREDFEGKQPLITSHIIRGCLNKRYDFIFVKKTTPIKSCDYYYEEGVEATSDHAIVKVCI